MSARIGLSLDPVGGFATLVWIPSGISLAALILWGYKVLPGIYLGAFTANILSGAPMHVALFIALGNSFAALFATFLLNSANFRSSLERLKDALSLIFLGGLISPVISATFGTTTLILGNIIESEIFAQTWIAWWVGDMLGIFIITPLILIWNENEENNVKPVKALEFLLLLIIFLLINFILFRGFLGIDTKNLPLSYVNFPILIWLTLRFGQKEVISILFLFSCIAIWGTSEGYGTFAKPRLADSLLHLQSFIGVTTATFLLFSSTMTERNNLERRKNDFISIASHELKTPLTSLKGYVQIIHNHMQHPKMTLYTARMDDQITRLTSLINQMLDSSRIGQDKLQLSYEVFDLSELIIETIDDIQKISTHKIKFRGNGAVIIDADKYRIRQVMENLIGNGIKFSPSSKKIEVKLVSKRGSVLVSIRDFGIGMDEKDEAEVFNRFYQADNNRRGSSTGLGLGLYISAGIIKLHRGTIWVKSFKGKGSTFFFQIPTKPTSKS